MAETPVQNISTIYGMGRSKNQCPWRSKSTRTRNFSNLVKIPITRTLSQRTEFVPKMMLTNVMSLVPKIDELRILTHQHSFDVVFITESWLRESVCDNHVTLFDYHLVRRDRTFSIHGGVCKYIKNSITFKRLPEIEHLDFEHQPVFLPLLDYPITT